MIPYLFLFFYSVVMVQREANEYYEVIEEQDAELQAVRYV